MHGIVDEALPTLYFTDRWQYDPTGDYLEPPLQGLVLVADYSVSFVTDVGRLLELLA